MTDGVVDGAGHDNTRGSDDTAGVVWDIPKEDGGYISEAVCWIGECQWRWTSDRREEVEREMAQHQKEVHGRG